MPIIRFNGCRLVLLEFLTFREEHRHFTLDPGRFLGPLDGVVVLLGAIRGAGHERALARVVHPRGHHFPPVRVLHLDGGDVARHGLGRRGIAQGLVRVPGDLGSLVPESEPAVQGIEGVGAGVLARALGALLVHGVEPPYGVLADGVRARGRPASGERGRGRGRSDREQSGNDEDMIEGAEWQHAGAGRGTHWSQKVAAR